MIAKGQDWKFSIIRNGKALKVFRAMESIDIEYGLEMETEGFVGEDKARVFANNGPVTFSCPFQPDSTEYQDLVDAQRTANRPNATATALRIDVTASVDFGSGGRQRIMIPGAVLHGAGLGVQAMNGRTKAGPTFTAPDYKRIS